MKLHKLFYSRILQSSFSCKFSLGAESEFLWAIILRSCSITYRQRTLQSFQMGFPTVVGKQSVNSSCPWLGEITTPRKKKIVFLKMSRLENDLIVSPISFSHRWVPPSHISCMITKSSPIVFLWELWISVYSDSKVPAQFAKLYEKQLFL